MNPQLSIFEQAASEIMPEVRFTTVVSRNEGQAGEPKTLTKFEGMRRAESNADPAWKDAAAKVVRDFASSRFEFTADDVLERLSEIGASTHDNRALGGIMKHAAAIGLIRKTDRVVNSRLQWRHSRPIAVWQSVVFGQS